MLTATYSVVAMSVEQANVRSSLKTFHQLIRSTFEPEPCLTPGQVQYACEAMQRLYDAFQWRKVELFLVPAVCQLTRVVDKLLLELDSLKAAAAHAMGALFERVRQVPVDSQEQVVHFCAAADVFCTSLLARLEREERELFPVARAILPSDAWFAIANRMLGVSAGEAEDDEDDALPAVPAAGRRDVRPVCN
jgi:hypothetical protein